MRRQSIRGRRGALAGASAAVVCLGGVLVACGAGGGGGGYVAVQRPASGPAVAPTGDVELVPLEKPSASKGAAGSGTSVAASTPSGGSGGSGAQASGPAASTGGPGDGRTTSPGDVDSGSTGGNPGSDTATPATPGPAALTVGTPERESADQRWCERVTVVFRNTGGTAVRSGTVTFGTHIIGALGIDWATIESAEELPVPIAAGAERTKTWTVCVDAWRVPLGMHIETRDVAVQWK
ncbi:hypothetical protein [Streptomyces sp. NBC_00620]|uniref:hypothetical protein n=1 Tax=Streptomyces sp. NBC_00620 TaxID=2903666 RepID=UPI002256ECC5|nr:hypothetical protein [Streptomyces sp. NBC_00620]MCX4973214.1 hypothetical protein [Streptomyces sp. NBC_00620]